MLTTNKMRFYSKANGSNIQVCSYFMKQKHSGDHHFWQFFSDFNRSGFKNTVPAPKTPCLGEIKLIIVPQLVCS